MQVSVWSICFRFIWVYIPRSGTAGSYDSSVFNFLRTCQTDFHSTCTIFHPHQQYTKVPIFPRPHQHLLSCFKQTITSILVCEKHLSLWLLHLLIVRDTGLLSGAHQTSVHPSAERCAESRARILGGLSFCCGVVEFCILETEALLSYTL